MELSLQRYGTNRPQSCIQRSSFPTWKAIRETGLILYLSQYETRWGRGDNRNRSKGQTDFSAEPTSEVPDEKAISSMGTQQILRKALSLVRVL